jgi:hypothetical protein
MFDIVDDYDFIYFDIEDEITTTRKFINLANNLRRMQDQIVIIYIYSDGYGVHSLHNLNIRKYKVKTGDRFIADITFFKNNDFGGR